MKISAITMLIWIAVGASTAAAEGTQSGKAASPGGTSKTELSEIRSLVHELQGRTEKLSDLMTQYRSHLEQRPQGEEQLAKWEAALDRLYKRMDAARAAVVETMQRLEHVAIDQLPTSLAKDLANARNEAGAQRTAAEQALAKNKPSRKAKQAKAPPEKPAPPLPADLDL
jgi:hypothetical protein